MTNENKNTNEETMTNEEIAEMITDYVRIGSSFIDKTKKGLLRKGFVLGLTTAVAIQSVVTIIVMLKMM